MIRILLIDDHPVIANGLEQLLLAHAMQLTGQVVRHQDIGEEVTRLHPDVIISESRLGGVDILGQLAELLQARQPPLIVVFSAFDDFCHIARSASIGVQEYVPKHRPLRELLDAVQRAADHMPSHENGLIAATRGRMRRPLGGLRPDVPLTARELQVLKHVALGLSNRETGHALDISVETVKEHIQSILRKLDVNDRTQAAVWAVRRQLV